MDVVAGGGGSANVPKGVKSIEITCPSPNSNTLQPSLFGFFFTTTTTLHSSSSSSSLFSDSASMIHLSRYLLLMPSAGRMSIDENSPANR